MRAMFTGNEQWSNEKKKTCSTSCRNKKHNKTKNYVLLFFSSRRFSNGFAKEDYEKKYFN